MTFFMAILTKGGDFSRCSAEGGFGQQLRKAVAHAEDRCEILDPRHFGTATGKSLILDGAGLFLPFRLGGCSAFDSSRLRREEILDLRRFKTADLESIDGSLSSTTMRANNAVGQLDEPIVIQGAEKVMVADGVGGGLPKKFGRKFVVVVRFSEMAPLCVVYLTRGRKVGKVKKNFHET